MGQLPVGVKALQLTFLNSESSGDIGLGEC